MKWPLVQLDELFEIARGGSPRPIDAFITDDPDGVNWVMIGDASGDQKYITKTKKKIRKEGMQWSRRVQPGDFLLTNSMSFGKPYIMRTSGCIHDGWLVLTQRMGNVDSDFFYHLLGSTAIYEEFKKRATGATVKNLNIDLVKNVEVRFPPLEEQRRIAAILDKADGLRQKRRAALQKLDSLTQSLFLDMFGDPVANPNGWPLVRFGSIAECKLGKMLDGGRQTGLDTYPYLRNANVQWNRLHLDSLFAMDFDESDRERFSLKPGDLLICEGGEPGRAAIWNGERVNCYYQKALHRCRLDPTYGVGKFFVFLFWELAKRSSLRFSTSTIAHLTAEKLGELMVPNPPVKMQQDFVGKVNAAEKQAQVHAKAETQIGAFIDSLQHRAFRGEL